MIEYERFTFAAPICTGAHWFTLACSKAGLRAVKKVGSVLTQPWVNYTRDRFVLSIVRHPFSWLHSYYEYHCGHEVGVDEIDILSNVYRDADDFREFIRRYLMYQAGSVSRMFDSYRPSSVMRYEDLPYCAAEFAESVGVPDVSPFKLRATEQPYWMEEFKDLRSAVVRAEREFCDRVEYY